MRKLVLLVASLGKNQELAYKIEEIAVNDLEFKVELINLVDLDLPLYSTKREKEDFPNKAKELSETIKNADALGVLAPEYNGSIPPVLNNAISWVSRSGENWRDSFNAKPTFIGTHSGGGGSYVLLAMRQQLSYIGANVIGRQLLTNYSKPASEESIAACLSQL